MDKEKILEILFYIRHHGAYQNPALDHVQMHMPKDLVKKATILYEQIITAQEGECRYINIVLGESEGRPEHIFIEIEDDNGKSISIGEWVRDGKFWKIRIPITAQEGMAMTVNLCPYCQTDILYCGCTNNKRSDQQEEDNG